MQLFIQGRTFTKSLNAFSSLLKISKGLDNSFSTLQLGNTSSVSEEVCALLQVYERM